MVERQPLIPRSRMDGGIVTEPHPALLESSQSPDQSNTISLHGSLRRRPGMNPLNMWPAMGSGIKSEAITWSGAAVNDDDRQVDRRNWKGSGIIPYHEAYDWSDRYQQTPSIRSEMRVRFVYKVGHKSCREYNAYIADWDTEQYRRFLVGSGRTKEKVLSGEGVGGTDLTTLGDIYMPDWVVYLLDGDDPLVIGGTTGGESYLALSFDLAGTVHTLHTTKAVQEGDVIDIMAEIFYDATNNRMFAHIYGAWDDGSTDQAQSTYAGESELTCSKRTIQVFGPYFPDYYWHHTANNANAEQGDNYDWERRRMIPGEGVIEDLVLFKTNLEAVFNPIENWPTKVRVGEQMLKDKQAYVLGHWPGWGERERQFVDASSQDNHGYLVPGEPTILDENDKLPGLLCDRVSEWVVKDFEYDTGDDDDQWQEGAMLRQFVEQGGRTNYVDIFKDPDDDRIIASLTIGATVTFHEGPNGDAEFTPFVSVMKKRSDDSPHPLMNTPDFDCGSGFRLCEITGFNGATRRIEGIIYNTTGANTRMVLAGPETPIGRPVTAVLSMRVVRSDNGTTDYNTYGRLYVNGSLVASDNDQWLDAEDQWWGPIGEVLSGRFHGEVHDIRMGVDDYPGDDETVTTVAMPDMPITTAIIEPDPDAAAADSLLPAEARINHDDFRFPFHPTGAASRQQVGVRILGLQSETEPDGKQWVTGFKDEDLATNAFAWTFQVQAPYHRAGRTNTVYKQQYQEVHFSWIYAWWRAWPHRAGDIRTRKPRTPGRCWQHAFHSGVGGYDSWFGSKSDTALVDAFDTFGDMVAVGVYSPYERYSTLGVPPMSPVFSAPATGYLGAPSRKASAADLGPDWGEGSRYPRDEDGAIGFVHQWKDGEGSEVFFGSGRNLYLWAPPWEDGGGTRLRLDGKSYWEGIEYYNELSLQPIEGQYNGVTVAFWYTRKSVRASGRVIVTAHGDDGTEAWSIYDHNGVLCVTIGDATYSTFPSGLTGGVPPNANYIPDDLFSDRRPHWVVVLIHGSEEEPLIKLWWDGEAVELYKNGVYAVPLQPSSYRLRVGGGAPDLRQVTDVVGDPRNLEMADADIDCVIGAVVVGSVEGGLTEPLVQVQPPEDIANLPPAGLAYIVLFSEGDGQRADNLLTAGHDLLWHGRDIKLLDENLPFLGKESDVPEVLQVEQDAALVLGTGRPRRWRRDLTKPSQEEWIVDYLGLPDPWEPATLEDVSGTPGTDVVDVSGDAGALDNSLTYAAALSFYDEERDIRTRLVYCAETVSPTNNLLRLRHCPGLPWGRATHMEVWLSTGGPYMLARRVRGTDHESIEVANIRYQDVVYLGEGGEPPVARHIGLLNERLYLGNLPYISEQAVMISTSGLPWCFPPENVFQFGDSQDGVITALHVNMGRVMIAQESLVTWFRPGAQIQNSSAEAIARSIGFRTRWGPVTWTGPLFGMTSRGPAMMDGVQFRFLARSQQDQFTGSDTWWVTYDGINHLWWFVKERVGEWCTALIFTEGMEQETWSVVRMPAIGCVGEVEIDGQNQLVFGTRLGRLMVMNGAGEGVHRSWEGSFSAGQFSAFDVGRATLATAWDGEQNLLRGQPILTDDGEAMVHGPYVDLHNSSLDITAIETSAGADIFTGAGITGDIGAMIAYWTTPWLHFGMTSRKKKPGQLWFAFGALTETMTVYFDSAMAAAVTRALERAFPAAPASSLTFSMANGFLKSPLQIGNLAGVKGIYFRFKIETRSNREPWETWLYTIEGELSGGRAE